MPNQKIDFFFAWKIYATKKRRMTLPSFRRHQKEADEAIYQHLVLENNDKCLVKMFCGTGGN